MPCGKSFLWIWRFTSAVCYHYIGLFSKNNGWLLSAAPTQLLRMKEIESEREFINEGNGISTILFLHPAPGHFFFFFFLIE